MLCEGTTHSGWEPILRFAICLQLMHPINSAANNNQKFRVLTALDVTVIYPVSQVSRVR